MSAILETTSHRNYARTLLRSFGTFRYHKYLRLGFSLLGDLRGAGIPIIGNVSDLSAHGEHRVSEVSYLANKVRAQQQVDLLLVHEGIVPNLNLWLSLRAEMAWNATQRSFQPHRGRWGDLSLPAGHAIGDCAHIGGATVAVLEGRLAALAIATSLDRLNTDERNRLARPLRRALKHELSARSFLDRLYEPAAAILAPGDPTTIVCRCEEVTAGAIREAVALGCTGPNQLKAFTRCGMGPCQGRLCGPTVVETIADARGVPPDEVGYYRIRSPVSPVTVGEIARSSEHASAVGRP